jgi:hypothetical protein
MTFAKLGIAAALAFAILVVASPSPAQTGATLVAIVTSEPNASLTRRVRAELQGLGVDVIVLKPPAEGSSSRAPLEQAARSVGAVAAVRLVVSSEGKVEIWVADRATGKAVVRELDATAAGGSEAAVAVGTVELLRASLMELHSTEPPHGDAPVTEKIKALALSVPSAPWVPVGGLAVGGGADLGLRGLGPSADVSVGVWVRVASRFGARVLGYTALAPARVATDVGSIDVRPQLVGAAATYDFVDASSIWVPTLSLGVAAAHLSTTGNAIAPYVGTTADTWSAAPLAGVGVAWSFAQALRLRADGVAAWALPAVSIHTPTDAVARWGAPSVLLTLGVEVMWGR